MALLLVSDLKIHDALSILKVQILHSVHWLVTLISGKVIKWHMFVIKSNISHLSVD